MKNSMSILFNMDLPQIIKRLYQLPEKDEKIIRIHKTFLSEANGFKKPINQLTNQPLSEANQPPITFSFSMKGNR